MVLPHLDAAYNLARWLTGDAHDAEDVVQEACFRALKFIDGFRGGNARAWWLTIVRRTAYSWIAQHRAHAPLPEPEPDGAQIEDPSANPDTVLARSSDILAVRRALEQLPVEYREVLVLREMEELSYQEIADAVGIPIGTVMSRLARARRHVQQLLVREIPTPGCP